MSTYDLNFEFFIKDLTDLSIWNPNHFLRLAKSHHENYKSIDASEIDLSENSNWPLFIDECVRALVPGTPCVLKIQVSETSLVSRDQVMQQIYNLCERVEILDYVETRNRSAIFTLGLMSKKKSEGKFGFTFGIVTDGNNLTRLERITQSIDQIKRDRQVSIETIVCGPAELLLPDEIRPLVDQYLPEPNSVLRLPITNLKKNEIGMHAIYENIVLSHDRYIFSSSVIDNFLDFGNSFDVCTMEATDENATPFPQWVAYESTWANALHLHPQSYRRDTYLNGGLFLVKKDVLTKNPINPLLFWGYGEDIEWSRRLVNSGFTPRLIEGKGLETHGHSENYSSWFVPVPKAIYVELQPASRGYINQTIGFFPMQKRINLASFISRRTAAISGLLLTTETKFQDNKIKFIPEDKRVRFSFYVEKIPVRGIKVHLEFENVKLLKELKEISCNGKVLDRKSVLQADNSLVVTVDENRNHEAGCSSLNFELTFKGSEEICIEAVKLDQGPLAIVDLPHRIEGLALRKYLSTGWSTSTEHGSWTSSKISIIRLPLELNFKELKVHLSGRLIKNENGIQRMQVSTGSGGEVVQTIHIQDKDSEYIEIRIDSLNIDDELILSFRVDDPVSPKLLGLGSDERFIGFELHSIEISQV